MRVQVIFKQQNPEFDKEYANQYHLGKESDGNRKDNWSKSSGYFDDMKELKIIENGEFKFKFTKEDGTVTHYSVPNVTILQGLTADDKIGELAVVSKKLIQKTHNPYNAKYNISRFYFYLKPTDEYYELFESVYLIPDDLPKGLLVKNPE